MRLRIILAMALVACTACAETVIDIKGTGAEKHLVSVDVQGSAAFRRTLERNLVLSGAFRIAKNAPLKVTGVVGGVLTVEKPGSRRLTMASRAADEKAARNEARLLSDKMCETYAKQKGFASDRIVFVVKNGRAEELCVGYPDGGDIVKLTNDGRAAVGPRWKNRNAIYYTGYLNNVPEVFEIPADGGRPVRRWGFGGLTTGAASAPGSSTVALIISKPFGNPELCTIDSDAGTWRRLTTTRTANEGQPCWSPDGRKIVYVSDELRRQHLFVINPETRDKRRLTSQGQQNVDPDWGPDGRIVYTTRRGGQNQIAVMSPADGDRSARIVTAPGAWEHPTWAADRRHVIAECDGVLYLIDTLEGGDGPVKLFTLKGKCMTPSFCR